MKIVKGRTERKYRIRRSQNKGCNVRAFENKKMGVMVEKRWW